MKKVENVSMQAFKRGISDFKILKVLNLLQILEFQSYGLRFLVFMEELIVIFLKVYG